MRQQLPHRLQNTLTHKGTDLKDLDDSGIPTIVNVFPTTAIATPEHCWALGQQTYFYC